MKNNPLDAELVEALLMTSTLRLAQGPVVSGR